MKSAMKKKGESGLLMHVEKKKRPLFKRIVLFVVIFDVREEDMLL